MENPRLLPASPTNLRPREMQTSESSQPSRSESSSSSSSASASAAAPEPEPASAVSSTLWAAAAVTARGAIGEAGLVPAAEKSAFVVVDVGRCSGGGAGDGVAEPEGEKVCRICQLSSASAEEGSELILLGCGCKGELGAAHPHCAAAWFKVKGNRCCEICGANAKNITAAIESMHREEVRRRRETNSQNSPENGERVVCWRRLPFCNLLMACLIIAFILLWFFRVSMF